jgi:Phytanoyl-CoA dioxygenase (PhyH)
MLIPGFCTSAAIVELEGVLATNPVLAGTRIFDDAPLSEWIGRSGIMDLVRSKIGSTAKAVRAILFDKTAAANWTVGWHQDRTIAVRERVERQGFDHWTVKSGVTHVEPPFSIIEGMLTARIHIDAVTGSNSPLLIALGSHRFGRVKEAHLDDVVKHCGTTACMAAPGDVWLYRTAIVHASEKSSSNRRRRVLQVDFSSAELPMGLQWLGIAERSPERTTAFS